MAVLVNQVLYYESAATAVPFAAMTDSGDHTIFTATAKPWSRKSGYAPVIAPYGLLTGGAVVPAVAAGNNNVDVAALTAMMPAATGANATTGVLSVNADTDVACARGADAPHAYLINSITVDATGAIAVVSGTGAESAHSETRGAAGGPPLIPVGSIEIAQVRYTSHTAGVVLASEIHQIPGTSQELSDFPIYTPDYQGGQVEFASALPLIHTGGVAKKVYVRCATPIFAELSYTRDWVPAKETYSVNSEAFYKGALGSASSSIGAASFSMALADGVTDTFLSFEGQNLLFKFKPDRNGAAYTLTQGTFSVAQTFGVKSTPMGTVTIAAEAATRKFAS